MRRLIVASILLAPLAGCSLVDQTWFNKPAPTAPAVPALPPPKLESRAPLIVIAFATAEPDYGEKLGFAIAAAEASRRGIGYDVFGMAPVLGTPSVQAQSERDAASNAAKVMRAIMANGVPPARIRLGVRTETGLTAPEVRVFVR